ncbi:MAG: hypothetical protein AB1664_23395, partial [Thermodesulfobacteriota bacterium]
TSLLAHEKVIFQGDGLRDLLFVHLPDIVIAPFNCMVLSNTCDMDPENRRSFPASICYAPIISVEKYENALLQHTKRTPEQVQDRIMAIRVQKVTEIFYLPRGGQLEQESMVLLDRICHCDSGAIELSEIPAKRIFTLSDYGAYLFLFKLAVHLTRMTDKVSRSA